MPILKCESNLRVAKHRTNIQDYFFLLLDILPVPKRASWILMVYCIDPSWSFYKTVFAVAKVLLYFFEDV